MSDTGDAFSISPSSKVCNQVIFDSSLNFQSQIRYITLFQLQTSTSPHSDHPSQIIWMKPAPMLELLQQNPLWVSNEALIRLHYIQNFETRCLLTCLNSGMTSPQPLSESEYLSTFTGSLSSCASPINSSSSYK